LADATCGHRRDSQACSRLATEVEDHSGCKDGVECGLGAAKGEWDLMLYV
jgi:hypothetical protein